MNHHQDWQNWSLRRHHSKKPIRYVFVQNTLNSPSVNPILPFCKFKVSQVSKNGRILVVPIFSSAINCSFLHNGVLKIGTQTIPIVGGLENGNQFFLQNSQDVQYLHPGDIITYQGQMMKTSSLDETSLPVKASIPWNLRPQGRSHHNPDENRSHTVVFENPIPVQNGNIYYGEEYSCMLMVTEKANNLQIYLNFVNEDCEIPGKNSHGTLGGYPLKDPLATSQVRVSRYNPGNPNKQSLVLEMANQSDYDRIEVGKKYQWTGIKIQ